MDCHAYPHILRASLGSLPPSRGFRYHRLCVAVAVEARRSRFSWCLALAVQEDVDRGEKRFGIGNPLLGSVKFRVKQHVIIGKQAVVLFFRKNLGQVRGQLARLDEVLTEEPPYGPMGGHAHTMRQQCGPCRR